MFSDKYIDQEDNEKFRELLFELLSTTDKVNMSIETDDDLDVNIKVLIIIDTYEEYLFLFFCSFGIIT